VIKNKSFNPIEQLVFIYTLFASFWGCSSTPPSREPLSASAKITPEEVLELGSPQTPYEDQVKRAIKILSSGDRKNQIDPSAIREAFAYFRANERLFTNAAVLVVDLSSPDTAPRGVLLAFSQARAYHLRFSHGKGSDRDNNGIATEFHIAREERRVKNGESPLGFFQVGSIVSYSGSEPNGLYLNGLERGINDDVDPNSSTQNYRIQIHSKGYADVDRNGNDMGRSFGCFVVSPQWGNIVRRAIAGGLLYAFHPSIYNYRK